MKGISGLIALCLAAFHAESAFAIPSRNSSRAPPTVNLGYEIHEGSVNATGDYYIFKNIPYAEQPINELRFQPPIPPIRKGKAQVNAGTQDVICPQAYPAWIAGLSSTQAANIRARQLQVAEAVTSESCLVLDVFVPTKIFNKGQLAKAPVLVWMHGGGFVFGSKTSDGNPAGLIARSKLGRDEGVIVVSINYRLGMFGWLAGEGVTPNLGLHDQRLALEWVQKNIGLFGGSRDRVTIAGESAGGASIVHHITAYGGAKCPSLFQAAIPMSPAWEFNIRGDIGYQTTLAAASAIAGASINDVRSLRSLSSSALIQINQAAVWGAQFGTFTFGPTTDGSIVPGYPQALLYKGKFDKSINVMASHVLNESATFTNRQIQTPADVRAEVKLRFSEASDATVDKLLTEVYPDVLDGRYPWQTEFARAVTIGSEAFFSCITRHLAVAKRNATRNYLFAVPPGYHADDVSYVFFNGDTTPGGDGLIIHPKLATTLQDYIVAFVKTGDPNAPALPKFPLYGPKSTVAKFTENGVTTGADPLDSGRCEWLQQAIVKGLL